MWTVRYISRVVPFHPQRCRQQPPPSPGKESKEKLLFNPMYECVLKKTPCAILMLIYFFFFCM